LLSRIAREREKRRTRGADAVEGTADRLLRYHTRTTPASEGEKEATDHEVADTLVKVYESPGRDVWITLKYDRKSDKARISRLAIVPKAQAGDPTARLATC